MYSFHEIDKLIARYSEFENSQLIQINDSVIGCGDWVLTAPGKKTAIVKEVFVNSWNSTHTVKLYNRTPKKYQKIIDNN